MVREGSQQGCLLSETGRMGIPIPPLPCGLCHSEGSMKQEEKPCDLWRPPAASHPPAPPRLCSTARSQDWGGAIRIPGLGVGAARGCSQSHQWQNNEAGREPRKQTLSLLISATVLCPKSVPLPFLPVLCGGKNVSSVQSYLFLSLYYFSHF